MLLLADVKDSQAHISSQIASRRLLETIKLSSSYKSKKNIKNQENRNKMKSCRFHGEQDGAG